MIKNLPLDVACYILSFLELKDIESAGYVSKVWLQVADHNETWSMYLHKRFQKTITTKLKGNFDINEFSSGRSAQLYLLSHSCYICGGCDSFLHPFVYRNSNGNIPKGVALWNICHECTIHQEGLFSYYSYVKQRVTKSDILGLRRIHLPNPFSPTSADVKLFLKQHIEELAMDYAKVPWRHECKNNGNARVGMKRCCGVALDLSGTVFKASTVQLNRNQNQIDRKAKKRRLYW